MEENIMWAITLKYAVAVAVCCTHEFTNFCFISYIIRYYVAMDYAGFQPVMVEYQSELYQQGTVDLVTLFSLDELIF